MPRLPLIDPAHAEGPAKELLGAVQAALGSTPNFYRVLAGNEVVLGAYLTFSEVLEGGVLDPAVREGIALTMAQLNGCEYCLASHALLAGRLGLTPEEIAQARLGHATDPRTQAALTLAARLAQRRGDVEDHSLDAAREHGLTDAEIVEIVAHVALNTFTNSLNLLAQTPLDLPRVPPLNSVP